MNALRKLIGGGKKKDKKDNLGSAGDYDYEAEHAETDFDKKFEEARRASSMVPQIISECDYRGSPSRANRSKSPTPLTNGPQQQQQKPPVVRRIQSGNRTPLCGRKGSAPGTMYKPGDSKLTPEKDPMKRKMTEDQQRRAKEIVESLDWVKPAEVCYSSSAQPALVARAESISPQIHVCEMIPMPRANPQMAVAIIPQRQVTTLHPPMPLAASGKMRTRAGT